MTALFILSLVLLKMEITDQGCGIENVEQAMEPMFTTRPDLERSGMGFSFIEAFMDCLEVESTVGQGTRVIMEKKLGNAPWVSDPGQEEE